MTERCYSSRENLRGIHARLGRKLPMNCDNAIDFIHWQNEARDKLSALLTLHQYESCPPLPLGYEDMQVQENYIRQRCILQTLPEVWMPFFILFKKGKAGKRPAVILPPVDGTGKFGVVWSDDYLALRDCKEEEVRTSFVSRWNFAFSLADAGYLVVAPDLPGTGECREWMDQGDGNFFHSSCRAINNAMIGIGLSLAGTNVWSLFRLADYLISREDCNGQLAIGGEGTAGMQALFFASLDCRVNCTFYRGQYMSFQDSITPQGLEYAGSYVPHLWKWLDRSDIGMLIAPRRLHLQGMPDDGLDSSDQAESTRVQLQQTVDAYKILGKEKNITGAFGKEAEETWEKNILLALEQSFLFK